MVTKSDRLIEEARNKIQEIRTRHMFVLNTNLDVSSNLIGAFYNFDQDLINVWEDADKVFHTGIEKNSWGTWQATAYKLTNVMHPLCVSGPIEIGINIRAPALVPKWRSGYRPIFYADRVSEEFTEIAFGTAHSFVDAMIKYHVSLKYLTRASKIGVSNLSYSVPYIHEVIMDGQLKKQILPKNGLFFNTPSRELGMEIKSFLIGAKMVTDGVRYPLNSPVLAGLYATPFRIRVPDPTGADWTLDISP